MGTYIIICVHSFYVLGGADEVQIGGSTPPAASDIKIFIDKNADDSVEVYTKEQTNRQFVTVINMTTKPGETTLTYTSVDGTTKNFKVGDEVRVPDAEADNGYTFYKLYALTTEEGVTSAVWDKLGAGGSAPVNPNETVNISLTQIGGSSADLIGAAVTITDDDSGDTLLTATWNGSTITTEIDVNTNYTVSVENITGYTHPSSVSYQAGYQTERNISFQYRVLGVYIEATDGTLYKNSTWTTSGKTANSIVLLTNNQSIGIALNYQSSSSKISNSTSDLSAWFDIHPGSNGQYIDDFNGVGNTNKIKNYQISSGLYSTGYAAYDTDQFTFPDGTKNAYIPAIAQMYEIFQNITEINNCLSIVNGTVFYTDNAHWQMSSTANRYGSSVFYWWIINSKTTANVGANTGMFLRVIKNYTF